MTKNISEETVKNNIAQLTKRGEEGFYRHLVAIGVKRSVSVKSPQDEMLELAESFLQLNRRTGEQIHADLYRLFRRAAHALYRQFNDNNTKSKVNNRFLHAV